MPARNPQIFGVGVRGRSAAVTAQRRVNCYVDIAQEQDRSIFTVYGLPGLTEFVDMGDTPVRGMVSVGANLYVAHRDNLYKIRNDGVTTDLGDLDTITGRVQFCSNNDYVMLVDGTSGYSYRESTSTFAKITDAQFPASPTSCVFLNGYFLVSQANSEQFELSALDDPTSWSGTDFDQAYADPDELLRIFAHRGVLVMLGPQSLEYWGYTGAADFPFERVLASQYGWGIAARGSIAASDSDAFALLDRREGGLAVCRITGGDPEPVSPPEMCALFDGYKRAGPISDAVGATWTIAGHPMYQITFPAAARTWMFDGMTGVWSERKSYGTTQYRGIEGQWHSGAMYWTDYENGKIWKQSTPTVGTHGALDWTGVVWIDGQDTNSNDRPVEFILRSEHIHAPGNAQFTLDAVQVDMDEGVGAQIGQGSAPLASLRISKDKGKSWSAELQKPIGAVGNYLQRVRWHRLGRARDVVLELQITDPVPRIVTGEALKMRVGGH